MECSVGSDASSDGRFFFGLSIASTSGGAGHQAASDLGSCLQEGDRHQVGAGGQQFLAPLSRVVRQPPADDDDLLMGERGAQALAEVTSLSQPPGGSAPTQITAGFSPRSAK